MSSFKRILFCPSPSVYGVFYAVFCTFVSVKPPTNKLFRFLFFFFFFFGSQIPKHPLSGAAATTVEETHLGWRFEA
jgi:hypothetical protein